MKSSTHSSQPAILSESNKNDDPTESFIPIDIEFYIMRDNLLVFISLPPVIGISFQGMAPSLLVDDLEVWRS